MPEIIYGTEWWVLETHEGRARATAECIYYQQGAVTCPPFCPI